MRLRRGARPSPRRGGERGGRPERSCAARLHEPLSSAPPTAAEETAAEETGGGVGDGSAAAALIAFIRRCLPSRRRRGMWTPLIGRERPARRGRRGPAPSPDALPRARRAPTPPVGPAPSRAPPPVTRIETARVHACARWPPSQQGFAGCGQGERRASSAFLGRGFRVSSERGSRARILWVGAQRSLPRRWGTVWGARWQGGAGTRATQARSDGCPWLASAPWTARAELCILMSPSERTPPTPISHQGEEFRSSLPTQPKSLICRLGNTASHTPSREPHLHRTPTPALPSPAGSVPRQGIPLLGEEGGSFISF